MVQWAGGLGAPVALGTPMAMAEWPRSGWASYQSPNTNNCQDLGNSILLLLGLIICINIGINMVTLVRARLGGRVLAGSLGGRPGIEGLPRVTVFFPPALAQTPWLFTPHVLPYCL